MTDWTSTTGEAILWEPEDGRTWALRLGGATIGRLTFRSAWGSLAQASCSEGEWTLKRMGFFRPHLTVRAAGSEEGLARMQVAGRVTSLRLAGGATFLWVRPRPRGSERAFTDEAGLTVVSFLPSSRRGRLTGPMTIASSGFPARTGALLAMVGWYRLVLQRMDEQMAMLAAVAAAAAGA